MYGSWMVNSSLHQHTSTQINTHQHTPTHINTHTNTHQHRSTHQHHIHPYPLSTHSHPPLLSSNTRIPIHPNTHPPTRYTPNLAYTRRHSHSPRLPPNPCTHTQAFSLAPPPTQPSHTHAGILTSPWSWEYSDQSSKWRRRWWQRWPI